MNIKENYDENDETINERIVSDPLDLMSQAIKVHTKGMDLNEDSTLSNLDSQLSKYAKYVMEQVMIVGILRSFFKTDLNIIRYSNKLDRWGEKITYTNPEKKHFNKSKQIIMNKVHSVLLLSRSVRGRPLKAFLTYGKNEENIEEKQKSGVMARVLGKEKKEEYDD